MQPKYKKQTKYYTKGLLCRQQKRQRNSFERGRGQHVGVGPTFSDDIGTMTAGSWVLKVNMAKWCSINVGLHFVNPFRSYWPFCCRSHPLPHSFLANSHNHKHTPSQCEPPRAKPLVATKQTVGMLQYFNPLFSIFGLDTNLSAHTESAHNNRWLDEYLNAVRTVRSCCWAGCRVQLTLFSGSSNCSLTSLALRTQTLSSEREKKESSLWETFQKDGSNHREWYCICWHLLCPLRGRLE